MGVQKRNLLLLASALIIISALAWITPDPLTANLLLAGFVILAIALIVQQVRWETRALPQPPQIAPPESDNPAPVILILGPYAKKWFTETNYTDSARFSSNAAWLLITTPDELNRRLDYFQHHAPATDVVTFFPFLPDGHDSVELINDQLMRWKQDFACMTAATRLPCFVAIYAQLSTELRKHSPTNTRWCGELEVNRRETSTLAGELGRVRHQLMRQDDASASDCQRAALGSELLDWMEQQQIVTTLQHIVTHSPLQLSGVLLCDYGSGFSRHGAWSFWLEERYGILPPLGSRVSMLPLPAVRQRRPVSVPLPAPPPRYGQQPAWLWSLGLVTLLLAAQISVAGWRGEQQQRIYARTIASLQTPDQLSVASLQQNLVTLQQLRTQQAACGAQRSMLSWGLNPCHALAQQVERQINRLQAVNVMTTAATVPLFEPGKARISPQALSHLDAIAQQIARLPHTRLLIIGHADSTGDDALNASLSLERATAVRNWLVNKHIDAARIRVRGAGAAEPVTSNTTATGRQANRRVEILLFPTIP